MSLNLSATTHIIEVTTTGAGSVNVEVSFTDDLAGVRTGGSQTTAIASATTTTVCAAPAASTVRFIDEITVMAVAANGVLVNKDISGTNTNLIGSLSLGIGERAQFVSARGWRVFNSDGSEKVGGAPALATTTEQLTGTDAAKASSPDSVASLWERATDNTGGATIALTEGGYVELTTSTTAITAFTYTPDKAGRTFQVRFRTARTLTHNATSLILPGGANITTADGDTCTVISLGSGNTLVSDYTKVSGAPPVLVTNAMLANMAANTIKAEATGSAAAPQDIALAVQQVLIRSAANIVAVTAAANQVLGRTAAGGNLGFVPPPGGLLRAAQVVLATNATFAHPTGTALIVAIVIAAGGGGTGAVNSAAAQITLGGGGASGGHLFHVFTSISGTSNVTIGAAGAAGANTGAAAGAGGNSSVVHNGVTVTAIGGPGAPANTTAGMAGVSAVTFGASPGALPPAVSTSANLNGGGNEGGIGLRFSGTVGQSGSGGGSMFGGAGLGRTTQGAGNTAIGPGGGGAGGLSSAAAGAVVGGAGFAGAVIFFEFG